MKCNYIILLLLACLLNACKDRMKSPVSGAGESTGSSRKAEPPIAGIEIDQVHVILKLKEYKPSDYPALKTRADSALHIASVLLNCKQFQDTMRKMDFSCKNYSTFCKKQCGDCGDRFAGQRVLDSAYRQKEVMLDLYLRNCQNEFGHSSKNIFQIFSCYPVIAADERSLPFAYSYGYHLAHEYMHIVGYFHFDKKHRDDVAERVGYVGWDIMLGWKKAGFDPMKIVLH